MLFELIQIRAKIISIFFLQQAGGFGKNIAKEPNKPRPKLKNYKHCIFTENVSLAR